MCNHHCPPLKCIIFTMQIPFGQNGYSHGFTWGCGYNWIEVGCYCNALDAVSSQRLSTTHPGGEPKSEWKGRWGIRFKSWVWGESEKVRSNNVEQICKWSAFLLPFIELLFPTPLPCLMEYIIIFCQFYSVLCLTYHCFPPADLQCLSVQAVRNYHMRS